MNRIIEWAEKGMHISIFTVLHKGRVEWSAGIRVGNNDKNEWLTAQEGCYKSSFLTPEKALEEAIKFCETYKPKATIVYDKPKTSKRKG